MVEVDATHEPVERMISNPYSIPTPKELIERAFVVASFDWTPSLPLQKFTFPGSLASIPTIQNILKRFVYYRFKVHLEIKMNSTQYHQGSLICAWLPFTITTNVGVAVAPALDYQLLSGIDNCVVLSASKQDTANFDIPWLNPYDFTSTVSGNPSDHSTLYIAQLNQLLTTNPSIPATVPILVWASFKDVEFSGYQSQSNNDFKFPTNVEAHKKESQGLDVKGAVSLASKIARKVPIIGGVWNPIADAGKALGLDLSKPEIMTVPVPTSYYLHSSLNNVAGYTDAVSMSMYPNAQLANSKKMFGMDTSHMSVSELAQRPMLFDTVTFNNTVRSWQTIVVPSAVGTLGVDYLHAVSKAFAYWRGSIKYRFQIVLPAFYSVRLRISLTYNGTPNNYGDLTTRVVDVKGDTNLDLTVPYLNIATWCEQRSNNVVPQTAPVLKIEQITNIIGAGSPTVPVVYINVWRAAGEDMRYSLYLDPTDIAMKPKAEVGYDNQMNPHFDFKSAFPALNDGVSQSIEKGNTMPEVAGSVSDMLKRASKWSDWTVGTDFSQPFSTTDTRWMNTRYGAFDYFTGFFMFWRGSRVVRMLHDQSGLYLNLPGNITDTTMGFAWATPTPVDGFRMQQAAVVPYYNVVPYFPLNNYSPPMYTSPVGLVSEISPTGTTAVLISGGEDYVGLFVVPWITRKSFAVAKQKSTTKGSKVQSTKLQS